MGQYIFILHRLELVLLLKITSETPVGVVEESGTEEKEEEVKCCPVCGKSFTQRTPAVLTFQRLHVSVSAQVVVAWWRRESWQLKQVFNRWLKCVFTFLF